MELKDMILSTLAEIDTKEQEEVQKEAVSQKKAQENSIKSKQELSQKKEHENNISEEKMFLSSVRERILVLFEGLQSPKNDNLDTKIDITLNFLEFLLASIDKRIQKVK